jgi:DNA-binding NarL/FixJ family response regulator
VKYTLIRILVVDDNQSWRRFSSTTIPKQAGLQVVGEAADGLRAIQLAQELQPDLVLLDIGLPEVNGIEAARQIRRVCPSSRILFLTEASSAEISHEALSTGALGYVVKSDAGRELLPAIQVVLKGNRFISSRLMKFSDTPLAYQAPSRKL